MKKKISIVTALVLAVIAAFTLSACGDNSSEIYYNISAQNNVYSMGTQTVRIEKSTSNPDEPEVSFKADISEKDITLGGALVGKSVTKVTYVDKTTIVIELSGNSENVQSTAEGTITVNNSGLDGKGESRCTVLVKRPEIVVGAYMKNQKGLGDDAVYNITATIAFAGGSFTSNAADYISLENEQDGTMTVTAEPDGTLTISVENCKIAEPVIVIGNEATVFDKQISMNLSVYSREGL